MSRDNTFEKLELDKGSTGEHFEHPRPQTLARRLSESLSHVEKNYEPHPNKIPIKFYQKSANLTKCENNHTHISP